MFGQDSQTTDPTASAWVYVFGQFLDHDIDLEATPLTNAVYNIYVPPENNPTFPNGSPNPFYQKAGSIAMNRSTRNLRTNTIINTTAGYLDLSQLYGSDAATAASLRNADGTLKTSPDGTALPIVNGAFVTGDPRVMENPELSAATILMREHNFWVVVLKSQHPNWSGDQLYNMAKAINTAEYQGDVFGSDSLGKGLPSLVPSGVIRIGNISDRGHQRRRIRRPAFARYYRRQGA
jgi:peroxidase